MSLTGRGQGAPTPATRIEATDDPRVLGWSRVALGALFLLRTTPLLAPLHIHYLADAFPLLAWPDGEARFTPALVPVLPDGVVAAACVARTVAAVAFLIGVATRPAGLLAGALGYLTVWQDPARGYTTFHVLFLGTMLLALTDAGATWALRPAPIRAPASGLALVRVWTASIYGWAGVAKLRGDWLDGRTLALFRDERAFRPALAALLFATPGRRAAMACAVVAVELALPALLLWRRTRRAGLVIALAMHAVFEVAAAPDLFGWVMAALLITFWQPRGGAGAARAPVAAVRFPAADRSDAAPRPTR